MTRPVGFHSSERRAASLAGRARQRRRSNRGVAVLEAAFVTPVFFTLVLGICEIGLAMNDYLALANAVRAGARVASASGNDVYSDYGILQSINRESAALDRRKIKLIVIYKPSGFGVAPTTTCQAGTSVDNVCNVYDVADLSLAKNKFGCLSNENVDRYWCPTTRKVTLAGTGSDYVGVWMKIEHPWLTKLFGNTKTLVDSSVIRLEPRAK